MKKTKKKKREKKKKSPEAFAAFDQTHHGVLLWRDSAKIVRIHWEAILDLQFLAGVVVGPPDDEANWIFRHGAARIDGIVRVLCRSPLVVCHSVNVTFKTCFVSFNKEIEG